MWTILFNRNKQAGERGYIFTQDKQIANTLYVFLSEKGYVPTLRPYHKTDEEFIKVLV